MKSKNKKDIDDQKVKNAKGEDIFPPSQFTKDQPKDAAKASAQTTNEDVRKERDDSLSQ